LKWVIDSHLILSSLLTAHPSLLTTKEAFLNILLTIFAHIVTFNHDEMVTPANRLLSFSVAE
jgi:hypothetical protein